MDLKKMDVCRKNTARIPKKDKSALQPEPQMICFHGFWQRQKK